MPVIDLIAPRAQEIADHVLARSLGAAGRGDRDKVAGGRKLRVEAGIDGVENSLLGIGVHCRFLSLGTCGFAELIKAHPPRPCGGHAAFRIRGRPYNSPQAFRPGAVS